MLIQVCLWVSCRVYNMMFLSGMSREWRASKTMGCGAVAFSFMTAVPAVHLDVCCARWVEQGVDAAALQATADLLAEERTMLAQQIRELQQRAESAESLAAVGEQCGEGYLRQRPVGDDR